MEPNTTFLFNFDTLLVVTINFSAKNGIYIF